MLDPITYFRLASDVTILVYCGLGLLLVAAIALLAEKRRNRREDVDKVGWMPWTPIFLGSLFLSAPLLLMALKSSLAN